MCQKVSFFFIEISFIGSLTTICPVDQSVVRLVGLSHSFLWWEELWEVCPHYVNCVLHTMFLLKRLFHIYVLSTFSKMPLQHNKLWIDKHAYIVHMYVYQRGNRIWIAYLIQWMNDLKRLTSLLRQISRGVQSNTGALTYSAPQVKSFDAKKRKW